MTRYRVTNWEDLSGDNPEFVALRNEALQQLRGVPEPHRSVWEGAKAVLGAESERRQDDRLKQLMNDLSGKLNRTVLIHPMLDLPSSLPNKYIAAQIENKASDTGLLQEFLVEGGHQGQPYSLEVTVLLETKPNQSADVGTTVSQAVEVDIGNPARKAIIEKAHKYGEILTHYVIAVWPKLPNHFSFGDDDDMVALYGDKEWVVPSYGQLREVVKPNGVFTAKKCDGTHRYSDISAVLFCHPYNTDSSRIYIHHNPFAKRPVGMNMLKGIPQCAIDLATSRAQWVSQ